MKSKSFKLDELKRGDRVAVYRTHPYKAPIMTQLSATTLSYSTASSMSYRVGHGFVMRVYKHIGAFIIRLGPEWGGRKIFIKEDDPQWSVYIEEVEG